MTWVKIDSWHAMDLATGRTLCGLDTTEHDCAGHSPELPLHEKSCETCLRLQVHAEEEADA